MRHTLAFALAVTVSGAAAAEPATPPAGYSLLFQQDFQDSQSLAQFVFTDPNAWRLGKENGRSFLEQFQKSEYEYPVRSPYNIALIANRLFGSFVLEADVQQTGREYGHRDICLFFSVQDPSHFYYNHIASKADDHAHNVFIVNGAPRIKITEPTTPGYDWSTRPWHRVRMVRDIDTGAYAVYMNGEAKPVMQAVCRDFTWGYVGFGSFDDTMRVTNIKIWGPEAKKKPISFFKSKP